MSAPIWRGREVINEDSGQSEPVGIGDRELGRALGYLCSCNTNAFVKPFQYQTS